MTGFRSSAPAPSPAPGGVGRVPLVEVGVGEVIGEVVIRLAKEPGVRQAGELSAALLGLSALRPPQVTLDLSELSCVSCLTLGVLESFRRGLVRAGGRVRLAAALQEPVHATLERAGLLTLLGLREEAGVPPALAGNRSHSTTRTEEVKP